MTTLLVAVVLTIAAGCGGDDGDVTSRTAPPVITAPEGELRAYCDAAASLSITLYASVVAIQQAPPDEAAPLAMERAGELQVHMTAARSEVPADIGPQLDVVASAIDAMAISGDFAELESPNVVGALDDVGTFNSRTCDWPSISLVTSERGPLVGAPRQLAPGFHAFHVRNDSDRQRQVDLYLDVSGAAGTSLAGRFPTDRPVAPEGVMLMSSSVIPPQGEATLVLILQIGDYAFALAEPAASVGATRQFVSGSVTEFRVVEGG